MADPRRPAPQVALDQALLAAQIAAKAIEATEKGVTHHPKTDRHEGWEEEWFYPSATAIQVESRRLLHLYELLFVLLDIRAVPGEAFTATYELRHAPSGGAMRVSYTGPTFRPSKFADLPHVVTATERYAARCVLLRELAIPIVYPQGKGGARGEGAGETTPQTPGGWEAPPSTASLPISATSPARPPFSPGALAAALEVWLRHERAMRVENGGGDPSMVDAWRLCRAHEGLGVVDGARPNNPSEYAELYRFLCDQADEYGWTFQEAA